MSTPLNWVVLLIFIFPIFIEAFPDDYVGELCSLHPHVGVEKHAPKVDRKDVVSDNYTQDAGEFSVRDAAGQNVTAVCPGAQYEAQLSFAEARLALLTGSAINFTQPTNASCNVAVVTPRARGMQRTLRSPFTVDCDAQGYVSFVYSSARALNSTTYYRGATHVAVEPGCADNTTCPGEALVAARNGSAAGAALGGGVVGSRRIILSFFMADRIAEDIVDGFQAGCPEGSQCAAFHAHSSAGLSHRLDIRSEYNFTLQLKDVFLADHDLHRRRRRRALLFTFVALDAEYEVTFAGELVFDRGGDEVNMDVVIEQVAGDFTSGGARIDFGPAFQDAFLAQDNVLAFVPGVTNGAAATAAASAEAAATLLSALVAALLLAAMAA